MLPQKMIVTIGDDTEWIIVSDVFKDRLEEVMQREKKTAVKQRKLTDFGAVMNYLEENEIPYVFIRRDGRDIHVVRYPQ